MNRHLWQQINDLRAEGLSIRAISRRTGVHRRTVRTALQAERPPQRRGGRRGSIIDAHRGWLLARLEQYPELSAAALLGNAVAVFPTPDTATVIAMIGAVIAFGSAIVLSALLPALVDRPAWRAFYVHLKHGFYANTVFDRLIGASR